MSFFHRDMAAVGPPPPAPTFLNGSFLGASGAALFALALSAPSLELLDVDEKGGGLIGVPAELSDLAGAGPVPVAEGANDTVA